jgi:hypothetical protein
MIRKATYIVLLAVVVLLAACTDDKIGCARPDEPRVVGVGVSEMNTRNYVESADQILSLGIFGYSTGDESFDPNPATSTHTPNLFENAETTRVDADASTPWIYDPVAVWPSDNAEKNTFFAYAPYMENGTVGTDGYFEVPTVTKGAPVIKYRVPQNISEQVDLLYSEYVSATDNSGTPTAWNTNVADINATTNSAMVKYTMKHALLWIRFAIATEQMVDGDTTTPEVDGDPATTGESYTITEFRMIGGNIMATGLFDLGTAQWSADPSVGLGSAIYEFDFLSSNPRKIEGAEIGNAVRLGAALGGNNSYLMIIPDDFKTETHEISIEMSYTHNDGSASPSETEYFVTMPFPDVPLTGPGSMMIYVVKVSTNGAHIEFQESSTIEKWQEDNDERPIEVF